MKILLVDDDPVSLLISKKLISFNTDIPKLEIIPFSEAKEALAYTLQHIDSNCHDDLFIFLDLNMPVFNGWDFLDHIKEFEDNRISVFILTSSVCKRDRQKAEEYYSVKEFLVKPLCETSVTKIFDGKAPSYPMSY